MRRRALLLLGGLVLVFLVQSSPAGNVCGSFAGTAPGAGPQQAERCAPEPLPSPFVHKYTVRNCPSVPPAGTSGCVTVSFYAI